MHYTVHLSDIFIQRDPQQWLSGSPGNQTHNLLAIITH